MTKHVNVDKYKYSGYDIVFDLKGEFSASNGFGRNCINVRVDMSSSVHVDHKKKYILVLGEGRTQGVDGTILTAQKAYSINFTRNNKKFCLSLHYNESNSYLFVNGTEIHKFKAKASEIVGASICLGNISKDFSVDNTKKKTELNGYVYSFSVDYHAIVVDDILDILKYLMKKNGII